MVTQMEKKRSHEISPQSIMLAKQAMKEMNQQQMITVKCPRCGKSPEITMTSKGERTIISCPCKYVYNLEINF